MRKFDLGQTLQVLGNAGVIVGILLLVYELNQNRDMMQAQTRHAIAETLIQIQLMLATDQRQQEIALKLEAGEPLTPLEDRAFRQRWIAFFRYWEDVNYQYRNGLYDEEEYIAQRTAWVGALTRLQPVRERWCDRTDVVSPPFFRELNELLGELACE